MDNITVYIGCDYSCVPMKICNNVCERSIRKFNKNVRIRRLNKKELVDQGVFYKVDPKSSTEFSLLRFLSCYLNDFKGIAIFCDNDFLWNCDICDLLKYTDPKYAVSCVKHNYKKCMEPNNVKFDNKTVNEYYPKKNWSSLMVFNTSHPSCKKLSIENVNNKPPSWLHQMKWCKEEEICEIPNTFNYLVGYYHHYKFNEINCLHYTLGNPNFKKYRNEEFANEWFKFVTEDEIKELDEYDKKIDNEK